MLKTVLGMGLALGGSVLLLTVLRHAFSDAQNDTELYALGVAALFTVVGVMLGRRVPVRFERRKVNTSTSVLSARELEVLELLREGLSNQEIADRLFVSTNTIKTHLASIYSKMNVRRRTEAVKRANDLGLLVNHPIG